MRLAIIADVHLASHRAHGTEGAVNNRALDVLSSMYGAMHAAHEAGVGAVVVAGDLFDTDRPSPQLIAQVQDWCTAVESTLGSKPRLLVGNHDQRTNMAGDHALAPLASHAVVIDRVRDDIDPGVLYVPFRTGKRGWWAEDVRYLPGDHPLIITHVGVCFSDTPAFLWGKNDAHSVDELREVMQAVGARTLVAGNYHKPGIYYGRYMSRSPDDVDIEQCGTFTPAGWDDPGLDYGHIVLTKDNELDGRVAIPGPRFLSNATPRELVNAAAEGHRVYCRVHVQPGIELGPEYAIPGVVVERVEDTDAVREAAREAARAAQQSESLQEAVHSFVGAMHLDGVDPADVESAVLRYLKVAK